MKATRASIPESATPKSHADFAVAVRVAAVFAEHPEVIAIAVGGSVARGIAQAHGGTLNASSSDPGQGATFVLTVPASDADLG